MRKWLWGLGFGVLGAAAAVLAIADNSQAQAPEFAIRNGEVGMIVSNISYGLGPDDENAWTCPDGLSKSFADAYKATHTDGEPQPGESERAYERRIQSISSVSPDGENLCQFPMAAPDPAFRTLNARNAVAYGIDLDGQVSRSNAQPAPGTCAHDDFTGVDGARGVDNNLYRVLGCTHSYRPRGQSNTFEIEMHTGSWSILIDLKGVDDLQNDPEVTVGIHAGADPIQVSAARVPLSFATYVADSDPRFRATARGRIVDGVLTTDPVDVRFRNFVNGIMLERPLRDARVRLTFAEGYAAGYLSGYAPIQEWYDNSISYSAGRNPSDGAPAHPARIMHTAIGAANVLGYTCNGMYQALQRLADGHPDPQNGRCTSISTQYRIRAIPAFVVNG